MPFLLFELNYRLNKLALQLVLSLVPSPGGEALSPPPSLHLGTRLSLFLKKLHSFLKIHTGQQSKPSENLRETQISKAVLHAVNLTVCDKKCCSDDQNHFLLSGRVWGQDFPGYCFIVCVEEL